MIAKIIDAKEYETKPERKCIKLTVLDDYEHENYIFIAMEALQLIKKLSKETHIPLILKSNQFISLNLNKLKNKLISVREDTYQNHKVLVY